MATFIAAFSVARFETQRWVRARNQGIRGASHAMGFFVDATFGIASTFGLVLLFALIWDYGWRQTMTLILVGIAVTMIWSLLVRDNFLIWTVATIACWPLMYLLGHQVSWFGLFE
jgi:hypothetical protein